MKLAFTLYSPTKTAPSELNPIILLHGRVDSRKTWLKLAPIIAEQTGRQVYAVDARNHGESPWSEEIDFGILASDLEQFLEEHRISKSIILGHSLGGRTAIVYALRRPETVEKLIVEDMQTAKYSSLAKKTVQMILHLLRESLSKVPEGADKDTATAAIRDFVTSNLVAANPSAKEVKIFEDPDTIPIKEEGGVFVWQANFDVLEKMLMSDTIDQSLQGTFDGPALFLYGTESFFDVEKDDTIYDYFPKAKKVPVADCGHLIHHNFPDEFLKHVIEFVNT